MARKHRRCWRCEVRKVRPPKAIAGELREFLRAIPLVAALLNPDAAEPFLRGYAESMAEGHAIGLARELEGECVYCAHWMDSERRAALNTLAGNQEAHHG